MVLGAVHFTSCLTRWIDLDPDEVSISTPFYYAVHRVTMATVQALEARCEQCKRLLAETYSSTGLAYIGDRVKALVARKRRACRR